MRAGTNVQRRLCALHHLDAPWRPRETLPRTNNSSLMRPLTVASCQEEIAVLGFRDLLACKHALFKFIHLRVGDLDQDRVIPDGV